jgi:tyrosinase
VSPKDLITFLDSKDVFGSVMFKDSNPVSGLGGWGDPSNDVRVPDGAFSNKSSFRLTYPSPHTLRRNWTMQPFLNFPLAGFMTDADEHLDANATFTPAERDKLVNGFVGDFVGFQKYFEGFNVCRRNIPSAERAPTDRLLRHFYFRVLMERCIS